MASWVDGFLAAVQEGVAVLFANLMKLGHRLEMAAQSLPCL